MIFPLRTIILAAGRSQRMGEPKGLWRTGADGKGETWLERQCRGLVQAGISEATLVLGEDHDRYLQALPALGAGRLAGLAVTVVRNPAPERGPFSSLQTALGTDAVFVLPIDVPAAPPRVWRALSSALATGAAPEPNTQPLAAMPTHDGRGGHPVLLSARFVTTLRALSPDDSEARLDHQLRKLSAAALARVPVATQDVLANLNTPADRVAYR